ncbi:MAG: CusA/CzcA family heavy metal efflux RND transporter [Planctomycetes bacterium]|nr:CusA/CzcA family heavy metal efflux RND transporter [Planctomycetota bacterium]
MFDAVLRQSIRNRWLVVLLGTLVAGYGVHSARGLPIDAVPDVTTNQVQINTMFAALTAAEIEKQVTLPVENSLAGIPGLESTRSFSRNAFSQVTAVFGDDVDIYFARNQIGERLASVQSLLPAGAVPEMGPITTGLGEVYMYVVEFAHPDGKDAPIVEGRPGWQRDGSYLTPEGERLRSDFERATYLRTVQDWVIRPQLRSVVGVAGVDSNGGYAKQYDVQPDPRRLAAHGLTFGDVVAALERNNVSTGAGFVERFGEAFTIRAAGTFERVEQIGDVAVATQNGVPVRIRDLGTVGLGRQARTGSATQGGREIVLGTALMLMHANSRQVAIDLDERVLALRQSLPPDVRVRTVLNRKKLVDITIATVTRSLVEGAGLVVLVLFLMLGNIRAALITALAIPLSMLMTATGMVQLEVSGNLMSLGAIDFGLIVDGAVIIVENCLRRLAERQHAEGRLLNLQERLHEVMVASQEMIRPSVYGQAIIVIVYLPILALTGVEGKMFRPMAATVIMALLAAFVLSFTLVPALVAICVRGRVREHDNLIVRLAKRVYAPVLDLALRLRYAVVGFAIAAFASSVALFMQLGSEFAPNLDEGDVVVMATRPISTSLEQATVMQFELEQVLQAIPEVATVFSRTGTAEMATDPMTPNMTDTFIMLKERENWPDPGLDKAALIGRLEQAIATVPGAAYEFTQPIQMRFNELVAGVRSDVAVRVYGDDFAAMERCADRVAATFAAIPGACDIKIEQTDGLPMIDVDIDRERAARFGLTMQDVQQALAVAVGGLAVGVMFEGDRRVDLVVRLPEPARAGIDDLRRLAIPLPAGASDGHGDELGFAHTIPLESVASLRTSESPYQFSRRNGKRQVTVQCNVRGRDLGSFVEAAKARLQRVELPPGGWFEWGGTYQNLAAARDRLTIVVPLAFFLILVLLFSMFHSVKYALLVFSCVPLGLSGGILGLWLRDMPFSISAAIGFIALSGVAVLNGVVMVSFVNQLRQEGMRRDAAIRTGCIVRLRPILITSLVASLGFVPMALATGQGAEVQRPLATVVIAGLVSSTLLKVLVLPALYRIFTSWEIDPPDSPEPWEAPETGPLEVHDGHVLGES